MCIVALNIWPVPPTDFASRVIPSIEGPVDGFLRHDTTGGESDDRFRDQKKKERDRELPVLYKYTQSSRTLSTIVQVCKYKVIKKPFSTNNMNFRPVRFFVVVFFSERVTRSEEAIAMGVRSSSYYLRFFFPGRPGKKKLSRQHVSLHYDSQ